MEGKVDPGDPQTLLMDLPHGDGAGIAFPARNSPIKAAQLLPHPCPAQEPQGRVGVLGQPQFQTFGSRIPVLCPEL